MWEHWPEQFFSLGMNDPSTQLPNHLKFVRIKLIAKYKVHKNLKEISCPLITWLACCIASAPLHIRTSKNVIQKVSLFEKARLFTWVIGCSWCQTKEVREHWPDKFHRSKFLWMNDPSTQLPNQLKFVRTKLIAKNKVNKNLKEISCPLITWLDGCIASIPLHIRTSKTVIQKVSLFEKARWFTQVIKELNTKERSSVDAILKYYYGCW